jgi:hypothetical protein
MLVKRAVYDDIGPYDESYRIISDYVFMIEAYTRGYNFFHLDRDILFFRNTGISHKSKNILNKERESLFSRLFHFLDEEDLVDMAADRNIAIENRLRLIKKYETKSELFARSMAFNIGDAAASSNRTCGITGCLERLTRTIDLALKWIDNSIYLLRHMPKIDKKSAMKLGK